MARTNVPFVALGNRGIVSPKALARVDLDRTRMSAEVYTNWLPKTQGALTIRPGTKWSGSSLNDTGAAWVEFVAATDDVALIELTHEKMRVWLEDTGTSQTPVQAGVFVPMAMPAVNTTISFSDTGWSNTSTGGVLTAEAESVIPQMTDRTTAGVTITESTFDTGHEGWLVGDGSLAGEWVTRTGGTGAPPQWVNVDFGTDTGERKAINSYKLQAGNESGFLDNTPRDWRLLVGQFDTGTYATDTGKWRLQDERTNETNWSVAETRDYTMPDADTGTIERYRHWRLYVTETNYEGTGEDVVILAELRLLEGATSAQVVFGGSGLFLNARSIGARARALSRVTVDTGDRGVEHGLVVDVARGPVTIRVGSTDNDDDYIAETNLGTGYHHLAFTPDNDFRVLFTHGGLITRIVRSVSIADTGTVEIPTSIVATDLSNVRYDQSADVVYVAAEGQLTHKIERRGTGRSWSFVEFKPNNGPFLPVATSSAKLSVSHKYGNTTMNSDVPFFKPTHAEAPGALIRIFHGKQNGLWPLGALDAATDPIRVTGLSDTGDSGSPSQGSERRIDVSVAGTYIGRIQLERSFEGAESGFHPVSVSGGYIKGGTTANDTGTFTRIINDPDDNAEVWYRARLSEYTSGVALVTMTYPHGGLSGIARVTGYNSNQDVSIEVLSRFSDTGPSDVWQEGAWSGARSFPSAVALHGGRLGFASGANIYLSVSDDFENFNDETEGDAAPIVRTLGSGPVDNIYYLISLLRLIIGTSGAEIEVRSSSLDEPLTPSNSSARQFSTQGSANIRAVKMDTSAIFTQRSGQRVFMTGQSADEFGGYKTTELTMLVPDLLEAGIVDIAIQRQPDTRVHCVLADGKVGILTYEPQEEVMCWSIWETDGAVEKAMVLPGTGEDRVFYHIRRTVNGAAKRFLEQWAMESECQGDTGLSWLADCARSYSDTGRVAVIPNAAHLAGESVVVWGDDTGQSFHGRDYSPDVSGTQTTYAVDTGAGTITLSGTDTVHHAVYGLPYMADWKSTKLAYAAEAGTALAQMKRVDKIGFVLYRTHRNGIFFGNDTGNLDPLPSVIEGRLVDPREIFDTFDQAAMPFPGLWSADSRIHLRAKAPRPCTVLAAVPTVATNEKV